MADAGAAAPGLTGRTVWARNLALPVREFLGTEVGSSLFLLGATVAALLWANVDWSSYQSVWATELSIRVGSHGITQDLHGWVNNGLMTFFFLVIGLEARREFDVGDLRERRRAMLPLLAGLGGLAVPVLIYLAFNVGGSGASGWGAAMSTDTAFALGVLALVGRSCPDRLRVFMLTVVVVDDLVALLVIGTAYSHDVALRLSRRRGGALRGRARAALAGGAPRRPLRGGRRGDVGRGLRVGRRAGDRRPRDGPADLRLSRDAARPRARDEAVPLVPRAADAGAGAHRPAEPGAVDLAERAAPEPLAPVDELR